MNALWYFYSIIKQGSMKAKRSHIYDAPSIRFFGVAEEGVICTSGQTETFEEGNIYDDEFFD